MEFIFLFIALISGVTKGYCGKKTSMLTKTYSDAMLANVIRTLLCIVIGFLLLALQGDLALIKIDAPTLAITLISAVASSLFLVCWLISVRTSAYMMVDVFIFLGVIIPTLFCNIFFDEKISFIQWIAIAILILSAYIMCGYSNSISKKITLRNIIILTLCGLGSGFADFSQKLFTKCTPDGSSAVFNLYTYLFTFIILLFSFLLFSKKENNDDNYESSRLLVKKGIGYIFVMAVCLFANSFFKTLAAKTLDAIYLYPIMYGGSMILSLLMSSIFFKEKINRKCVLGISLSFVAILLITFF